MTHAVTSSVTAARMPAGSSNPFSALLSAGQQMARAARGQPPEDDQPRYERWFFGPPKTESEAEDGAPRIVLNTIDLARMQPAEIARATLANLGMLGQENYAIFTSKLPPGHRLRREIEARLINRALPHLGSCKLGQVIQGIEGDLVAVQQVFIGNFSADIDTSGSGEVYRLKDRGFHPFFYGLHVLLTRDGKFRGFDHSRGRKGLAFSTSDPREAHFSIASAALGRSVEELKALTDKAKKG